MRKNVDFAAAFNAIILVLLITSFLLISGCSIQGTKKDTRTWVPVSCSIYMQRWNTCYKEAHAICPNGYDIYNVIYSEGEQLRKMEIACKS